MVNIRALANRATSQINPNITIGWRRYLDHAVNPDGTQAPSYATETPIVAQVQALTNKDLRHLSAMNITTAERSVYANVQFQATDRKEQTGGDLLVFEGRVWLVEAILEGWVTAGWSKVAVSKQMDAV